MAQADDALAVTMVAEPRARALLAPRRLRLRMVLPPFPAVGLGTLRVLRVREEGDTAEVTAGYDRYERLVDDTR